MDAWGKPAEEGTHIPNPLQRPGGPWVDHIPRRGGPWVEHKMPGKERERKVNTGLHEGERGERIKGIFYLSALEVPFH